MEPVIEREDLQNDAVVMCMVTCHSLVKIDEEITGDPLDLILFKFIEWVKTHLISSMFYNSAITKLVALVCACIVVEMGSHLIKKGSCSITQLLSRPYEGRPKCFFRVDLEQLRVDRSDSNFCQVQNRWRAQCRHSLPQL